MIPDYEQLDPERISHGWAPCAHSAEERERLEREYFGVMEHSDIESLLWALGDLSNGEVGCASDQWVRVIADGVIFRPEQEPYRFRTSIQGDTFRLALAESVKRWEAKYAELGVDPDE